jgi:hypothetical protein
MITHISRCSHSPIADSRWAVYVGNLPSSETWWYWVESGPPISWKSHCKGLNPTIKNLDGERLAMEDVAHKLWKKVSHKGSVSV